MPLVQVTVVAGRGPEQLRALVRELHEAVVRGIGAAPEQVRVIVHEVPPTHWAAGGETIAERTQREARGADHE
jgi:4-oxalocrotonate tautomerase